MPIGNSLLVISCAMALVATIGYGLALFNRNSLESIAGKAYYIFTISTVLMSLYLFMQILQHNFTLRYVFDYSSRDLSLGFLISTFWAGQVGSFLFWLLCIAVIGIFLIRRKTENHSAVMFFYILVIDFFLILLVARSPFMLIPQEFLAQFPGGVPPDGNGLNPLLQNFWMVIHPPIVFVGFALIAVPFSYALGALSKNNYKDWVKNSLPWTAIASVFLGAGIFLGGYWAYETLGWGGYWAWDPVENTSLIPWIINVALMHGLLVERNKGVLRRSNLLMAMFSFLLVIYGTFLTRSGVLADFSVHSFTDLGISGILIIFILFFLSLSAILLLARVKSARTGESIKDPYSVDFSVIVGVFVLFILSILTLVGTSAPLLTRIFSEPASVSIDFYNRTTLPLAVVIAFLAGLSPFLVSKNKSLPTLMKRLSPSLILSLAATIYSITLGVHHIPYVAMIFFACFALFGNISILFLRQGRIGLRLGGFLTHMGFGIMMIGIVISSAFSTSDKVNLYTDSEPVSSLGYQLSYNGFESDVSTKDNSILLEVDDGSQSYEADPKFFIASENDGLMRKPYIHKYLLYDLYLSPQKQQTVGDGDKLILSKGETSKISDYEIKFIDFDMDSHSEGGTMMVGAKLEVKRDTTLQQITPYVAFGQGGREYLKADMPDGDGSVILNDIHADAGMISLQFSGVKGLDIVDLLVLEVSEKPLINMVWLGVVLIVVGSFISFLRRRKLQFR